MVMCVCKFWHTNPCLCAVSNIISHCFVQCDVSLQVLSTVRRDNVQFFTKRRFSALFWLTRTSPGANFHIGGHVYMQLFTNEIMSEITGLTHAKDCEKVYSLWKNVLMRNFLTYMDVYACKFSHERTCLYTTCPIISYVWAPPTCFHAMCRLEDVFMRVFTH